MRAGEAEHSNTAKNSSVITIKEGLLVSPGSPNQTSIHGKFGKLMDGLA